ncbi:hypothetical protein A2U01_0095786 [Trifolium medium]|uniref:Uncharacterized protein n=1 Tax=Trifolium medium TaxID=97028 RepID=A0A392UM38_9FABA|nr:hypothetical protein [Trifolium medium]
MATSATVVVSPPVIADVKHCGTVRRILSMVAPSSAQCSTSMDEEGKIVDIRSENRRNRAHQFHT